MHPISQRVPTTPGTDIPTVQKTVPASTAPAAAAASAVAVAASPSYRVSLSADGTAKAESASSEAHAAPQAHGSHTGATAVDAAAQHKSEARHEQSREADQARERAEEEREEERRRARQGDNVRWTLSDDRSAALLTRTDQVTHKVTTLVEVKLLGAASPGKAEDARAEAAQAQAAAPASADANQDTAGDGRNVGASSVTAYGPATPGSRLHTQA